MCDTSSAHWTYAEPQPPESLFQGDVLKRTEYVDNVLRDHHPYFTGEQYTHFMVLTQSCDLYKRGPAECRADYITLAAVRPVSVAITRRIQSRLTEPYDRAAQVGDLKLREDALLFIHRLMNNNEPEYFYLHPVADKGLDQASCAILKLNIPIKVLHYEVCIGARILSLEASFRAKLGWLLGNLVSRVGTREWKNDEMKEHSKEYLSEAYIWKDERILVQARGVYEASDGKSRDELRDELKGLRIPDQKDKATQVVIEEIGKQVHLSDQQTQAIARGLRANDSFVACLK